MDFAQKGRVDRMDGDIEDVFDKGSAPPIVALGAVRQVPEMRLCEVGRHHAPERAGLRFLGFQGFGQSGDFRAFGDEGGSSEGGSIQIDSVPGRAMVATHLAVPVLENLEALLPDYGHPSLARMLS